jgi:basic membrane protein A
LKGRAAFVAGVAHADPQVKVLTGFCGTQDDSSITRGWTEAEISAGADIIFTMLNGARKGAIEACRAGKVRQIGNALDWVSVDPKVFVASAIARIDLGVERAISDMANKITPKGVVQFGLADGAFVKLSMWDDVPLRAKTQVVCAEQGIRDGQIVVPETYNGLEFQPEGLSCVTET